MRALDELAAGWEVDGRLGATHYRNKNIFSAIQECCFCLAFQPSVLLFPSMRGCFIVISKVGVCPSLCLFSLTKRVWRWRWVGLLAQLGKCYSTRRQFIAPRHLFFLEVSFSNIKFWGSSLPLDSCCIVINQTEAH